MPDATYVGAGTPCGNCGNPLTPGQPHKCGRVGNPYAPSPDWKPGQDTFTAQAAGIWDEGYAAGLREANAYPQAWRYGAAEENARIVAALRAKGTHAANVLADQIEREAP